MKRSVSTAWNSRLFLTPASVSAGDLLLVALKMPPSRTGTYSNFTLVRCSIAGIASWLRKALGLPKSNRNWGFEVKAVSRISLAHCGLTRGARPQYHDGRNTAILRGLARCRGAGRIWRADRVRSGRSRWFAIAEGEPDDVVADIIRPA